MAEQGGIDLAVSAQHKALHLFVSCERMPRWVLCLSQKLSRLAPPEGAANWAFQAGASGVNSTREEQPTVLPPFSSVQERFRFSKTRRKICAFLPWETLAFAVNYWCMCVCVSVGYLIPLILCYISTFPSFSKHLEEASIRFHREGKQVLLY